MGTNAGLRDPTRHITEVNLAAEIFDASQVQLSETYPVSGSTSKDPRLTFGVEYEMALGTLRDICENPSPEDGRKVYGVARAINSSPLDYDPRPSSFGHSSEEECAYRNENRRFVYESIAQTLHCAGFPAVHVEDPEYKESGYTAAMAKKWIIGVDHSITYPDEAIYDFHQIEIKSPVFYFSEGAICDITRVWELIASTYKVVVNESMGLHVHVGNGVDAFDGETLRNLWAIFWTTEKWIATIHPLHRTFSTFCRGFHDCSNLEEKVGGQSLKNPAGEVLERKVLEWILGRTPPSVEEFLDTISIHSGAYNFVHLQKSHNVGSIKRTIEFRQHEATLDVERVKQWVRVCIGLVRASTSADPTKLDPYLRQLVQKQREKVRVGDILSELGLKASGSYYKAQVPRERGPVRTAVDKSLNRIARFLNG
ncbi:hypothetical protein DSL72_000938 [Monilinia vaccinii-corymbosi]|uniref:Amidoligase enzyme n=1 Tax=Monilinia vaccinii-corymbosi TaxID=61207 RepID=A0A8A3P0P8_9HELO|nr:hypothetical protein DSL72_000938 [Monilinia vaccinii-corymbosi]